MLDLGLKKVNLMIIKLNNALRCFVVVCSEYHFPAPALAYFAAVSSKGEKRFANIDTSADNTIKLFYGFS